MRLILIIAAALAAFSWPAQAQQGWCASRDGVVKNLERNFTEIPVAKGLGTGGGYMIEVYTSADGATFTILKIWPNGMACFLAAGENWRAIPPPEPGEPL